MTGFRKYHPLASAAYILSVTMITALVWHPYITIVSLIFAAVTAVELKGIRAVRIMAALLPFCLLSCGINLLFNNAGSTVLFYLPTGNAATLETLIYSLCAAAAVIAMVMWFYCANELMGCDKTVYLLGRAAPGLGLLISMIMRFIPLMARRIKLTVYAQRFTGCDIRSGGLMLRLKNAFRILSTAIAAAAEGAAQSAISMKARGYGAKNVRRSSYTIYRFALKEWIVLAIVTAVTAAVILGCCTDSLAYGFYPNFYISTDPAAFLPIAFLAVLCVVPITIDIYESRRIKHADAV